jgi:hypothetical protein
MTGINWGLRCRLAFGVLCVLGSLFWVARPGEGRGSRIGVFTVLVAAVAGAVILGRKSQEARGGGQDSRLKIFQRMRLGQECQLLLVECDGQSFMVVHGKGFASIRETPGELLPVPREHLHVPLFSPSSGKALIS